MKKIHKRKHGIEIVSLLVDVVKEVLKTVILATLTSLFFYLWGIFFGRHNEIKKTYEIYDAIHLGEHKEYIVSMLGTPRYEFTHHGLNEMFFPSEYITFRCVFDKTNVLIGYFVTLNSEEYEFEVDDFTLGKSTFKDFGYGYSDVKANIGCGGGAKSRTYYWEYAFGSGVSNFKGYIVAVLPYGFWEDGIVNCISEVMFVDDWKSSELYEYYRETLHPNTYGIIDSCYEEYILPYVLNDDTQSGDDPWMYCVESLSVDCE